MPFPNVLLTISEEIRALETFNIISYFLQRSLRYLERRPLGVIFQYSIARIHGNTVKARYHDIQGCHELEPLPNQEAKY